MRLAAVLLLLLAAPAVARAEPPAVEDAVFVEIETDRASYFVHEPIPVRILVGIERGFRDENLVSLFRREMDLPVQVRVPEVAGSRPVPLDVPARTLALGDDVVAGRPLPDRVVDGRTYLVVAIDRILVRTESGDLSFAAPVLRLAYGTEFEEDFLHGRRALDRRDVSVAGEPLVVRIHPLPDEGRPASFTGGLGRFAVRAEATPVRLRAGETLTLTLVFDGPGDLTSFARPDLGTLPGFHVLGAIDDRGPVRRTIRYDLSPTDADVTEIPAIPFSSFDPTPPAGYRIVRTEPIPLEVAPGEGTPEPGEPGSPEREQEGAGAGSGSLPGWVLGGLLALVVAIGLVLLRRRRSRARPDPEEQRALGAEAAFESAVARPDVDLAEAFTEYLAANLRCPPATVISPDLRARLEAAGVAGETAERVAGQVEELVGARYGGKVGASVEVVRALVSELESVFRAE